MSRREANRIALERAAPRSFRLDGCRLFIGATRQGYGYVNVNGTAVGLHRAALQEHLDRELQPGELATHTCHNKRCFEVSHLRVGTSVTNALDAIDHRHDRPVRTWDELPPNKLAFSQAEHATVQTIMARHAAQTAAILADLDRDLTSVITDESRPKVRRVIRRVRSTVRTFRRRPRLSWLSPQLSSAYKEEVS